LWLSRPSTAGSLLAAVLVPCSCPARFFANRRQPPLCIRVCQFFHASAAGGADPLVFFSSLPRPNPATFPSQLRRQPPPRPANLPLSLLLPGLSSPSALFPPIQGAPSGADPDGRPSDRTNRPPRVRPCRRASALRAWHTMSRNTTRSQHRQKPVPPFARTAAAPEGSPRSLRLFGAGPPPPNAEVGQSLRSFFPPQPGAGLLSALVAGWS